MPGSSVSDVAASSASVALRRFLDVWRDGEAAGEGEAEAEAEGEAAAVVARAGVCRVDARRLRGGMAESGLGE